MVKFNPLYHKDEINKLKRNEQITIFTLRLEHVQVNSNLNSIGAKISSACPPFGCPDETVKHHLFVCSALDDLRREYIPPKADTANILFSTKELLRGHLSIG